MENLRCTMKTFWNTQQAINKYEIYLLLLSKVCKNKKKERTERSLKVYSNRKNEKSKAASIRSYISQDEFLTYLFLPYKHDMIHNLTQHCLLYNLSIFCSYIPSFMFNFARFYLSHILFTLYSCFLLKNLTKILFLI